MHRITRGDDTGHRAQLAVAPQQRVEAVELESVARAHRRGLEHRQAAVARDREEQRLEVDRAVVLAQRPQRLAERLAHRALGAVAAAEHVPAEGEQREVVALEQGLDRRR